MRFAKPRLLFLVCTLLLASILFACGGSSSSHNNSSIASGSNAQSIVVNSGPAGNYANGVFTTVNVCAPGTSNCQSVSGVLVDTGSFGLRILASALTTVNSALPQQKNSNGDSVLECGQFVDSVLWGPVKNADISMGGQTASAVPIEVVDDSSVPVPSSCSSKGPAEETLQTIGANGILGIGFLATDCGQQCATTGQQNLGFYYNCSGSSCQIAGQSMSQQVQNPVALFPQNNNGVVVQLPATTSSAASITGSLIFGIGTQSDNDVGSAKVYTPDRFGNLSTTFKGISYPSSGFIDSGSNAYFISDSTTTGMPACPSPESGFYCPSSPASFSATISGGSSSTFSFTIGNADQLFSTASDSVFPTLGGPNSGFFDWGLPFFYGRTVFIGIEGRSTPAGPGPFWAF